LKIGISKYLNEINRDFNVFGLFDGEWHKYEPVATDLMP
jgi:hypothetical protein